MLFLRAKLKEASEACGRDVCPNCRTKMKMGLFNRYYCPRCGYRQGHGYF